MRFNKEFSLQMNGNIYHAQVEGSIYNDEYDRTVIHSVVDEEFVILEDDEGKPVTDGHEDFEDLMEDVLARNYEPTNWG